MIHPFSKARLVCALGAGLLVAALAVPILEASPRVFVGVTVANSATTAVDGDWSKRMRRALKSGDEVEVAALLGELGSSPDDESIGLVLDVMGGIASAAIFDTGLSVLKALGSAKLDTAFRELLDSRRTPSLKLAALVAVAEVLDDDVSEEWLVLALGHKSELVLRNAMDVANSRRSKKAVPALIELLNEKGIAKGTISYNARRVLVSLTGYDFETVEDWRNFWESNHAKVDPKNLGKASGTTGVARRKVNSPTFFDLEIVSRRVVFVIDISGSMTKWDEGGEAGGSGSAWQLRQRIRRTKIQLIGAIRKLASGSKFNVIAYNSQVNSLRKSLAPVNSGSKSGAAKWIARLDADDATHTDEALEQAFKDRDVDTIILLSDGAPTKKNTQAGQSELANKIIKRVRTLNRLKKIRIFTLGFEGAGKWPPGSKYSNAVSPDSREMVDFLKRLAKENGGTYTTI